MMGQSLSTAAVSGSNPSLADEALAGLAAGDPTALLALHRAQFGGYVMEDSDDDQDDDTGGADDQDDDADDEDDEDDSDDDADDEDDKPKGKTSKRVKQLSDENARHRTKNKELRTELDGLKAELKQLKDKDKPEDEKTSEKLATLEQDNQQLADSVRELRIQNAFLKSNEYKWKNPQTALRLADLSEVEIDDDGEVTGLKEALKKLAKSESYLIASGDDEDDEDEGQGRQAGQPTGGRGKGKANANRDRLLEKYPALRR